MDQWSAAEEHPHESEGCGDPHESAGVGGQRRTGGSFVFHSVSEEGASCGGFHNASVRWPAGAASLWMTSIISAGSPVKVSMCSCGFASVAEQQMKRGDAP